jgi:hypothetical protein
MKITLPSLLVAYDLFAKMSTADPNTGRSLRGLNVQVPSSTIEAANAGVTVKFGRPNAGATAVDEDIVLSEGDNYNFPQDIKNTLSLPGRSVIASVDNAVLYLTPLYA